VVNRQILLFDVQHMYSQGGIDELQAERSEIGEEEAGGHIER